MASTARTLLASSETYDTKETGEVTLDARPLRPGRTVDAVRREKPSLLLLLRLWDEGDVARADGWR